MRLVVLLAVLIGCGPEEVEDLPDFSQTTALESPDASTCEPNVYWPAGLYPLLVDRFTPPEPPYEITHIGAVLFQGENAFSGRDCALDVGLHVLVWPADGATLDAPIATGGVIDVTPLAEAFVTVDPTAEPFALGTVALDPPVRVEQPGDLWVGMGAVGDVPSQPGACLAGCDAAGDGQWQGDPTELTWSAGATSLALFQITVAHD